MTQKQILVTEDGSHTLFIPELDETYHSTHGAIEESNFIFIDKGLHYYIEKEGAQHVKILEVGFGTGLNALLSAVYAEVHGISIHYEGVEAFPLAHSVIQQLNYALLIKSAQSIELFRKINDSLWNKEYDISSDFLLKKVKSKLQEYKAQGLFDVVFFDAFSPSKQPEMWELSILQKIWDLLNPNGVLVTYCSRGQLKRDLKSVGFTVDRLPGPPAKRHMIRAIKNG